MMNNWHIRQPLSPAARQKVQIPGEHFILALSSAAEAALARDARILAGLIDAGDLTATRAYLEQYIIVLTEIDTIGLLFVALRALRDDPAPDAAVATAHLLWHISLLLGVRRTNLAQAWSAMQATSARFAIPVAVGRL